MPQNINQGGVQQGVGQQNGGQQVQQNGTGRRGRGFAGMDEARQREIASKGGKAAHAKGTAHEFTPEEARRAGRKGGEVVSQNREHMAMIGREGGQARGNRHRMANGSYDVAGDSSRPPSPSDRPAAASDGDSLRLDDDLNLHAMGEGREYGDLGDGLNIEDRGQTGREFGDSEDTTGSEGGRRPSGQNSL